ncbi:DUF2993 domain-containing protein [Streptomyces sp. NPDC058867]|uniref:LmeA family phospholipid-binding protein n=1 Tax=unclassified Streptomyces TaxID=2593676 RepID=UPI0036BA9488
MHHSPYAYDEYGDDTLYEAHEPERPRRPRRPLVVAAAAVLALTLLPVALDRFLASRAEARTAQAFQEGMGTALPPEVHIRGFPVVTQLVSGALRQVDITAHDIPAHGADRPLPVSELELRLRDLRRSDDGGEARARGAEATARLSYPDVSNALGVEISQGGSPGEVAALIVLPFADQVTVTTTVSALSGNRIAFRDFRVTGGALPGIGRKLLDKVFEQPVQLRNIPRGLTLRSVTTTPEGLTARFSGSSVTFTPEAEQGGTARESAPRNT